ncbi:MAG: hypothetical protein ABSH09_23205 [Bryobacteraceae bacterium]
MIDRRAWFLLAALTVAAALSADLALEIPPVPVSVNIAGQPVAFVISGTVSTSQPFNLNLHTDLSDFQNHLTSIMQTELNQSNHCGERISIEQATLEPAAPTGHLNVQLHFEKWACLKVFGKENAKRLIGGNGTVQVILTPRVEDGKAVRLDAEVGKIDADGSLGEVLRSGSLGVAVRDKIRAALLKAIEKSTGLEAAIPEQARPFVTIQSAAFADAGSGRLSLNLAGQLLIPSAQVSAVLDQFRKRAK